jgi:type I restriction enzyme S subunit
MKSDWSLTRLGDLISLKGGLSYKSHFVGKGNSFLVGMGAVSHSDKFIESGMKTYGGDFREQHRLVPGDIVIATRQQSDNLPILGFPAMVPKSLEGKELIVATNLWKVFNTSDIDNRFLFWLLRGDEYRQHIISCSKGTTVRMITKDAVEDFYFYCPPRRERVAITNLLDRVDDKIQLNRQINQTLEQMAQAIFKSWFVDFEPVKAKIAARERWHALQPGNEPASPVCYAGEREGLPITVDLDTYMNLAAMQAISGKDADQLAQMQAEQPEQYAELRATAELFPSAMHDSELGEIPEGWRQRQVGELATIKGGKQRSRDLISNIGPVPVFGGAGIMGYTDEHNADGFVISVGRVGAYCGQFFSHRGPSWVNNNASLIRPSNINHGEWLFIALQNIDLAPIKKGAAQPFVSNSDLAKLQVVWPGDMVIEKFTQQLRNLFLLQETLLQQSDSLSTLRDTLLPELLAGRLDTSVIGS